MLISSLFSTKLTPHGFCLLWQPGLLWLHAMSDLLTAAAYFSIPLALISMARQRGDIAYRGIIFLFASFIVACGLSHVFEAITLWYSYYWIEGILKAITAILSIATAAILWPLIPRLVAIPSAATLQAVIERLQATRNRLFDANRDLALGEQIGKFGHWRLSIPAKKMTFSDEALTILGWKQDRNGSALDDAFSSLGPNEQLAMIANIERAISKNEKFEQDVSLRLPGDQIKRIQFRGQAQPHTDARSPSLFGVAIDKTEDWCRESARLEREEALEAALHSAEQSESLYRLLAENVSDIVACLTDDLTWKYVSDSIIHITGYPSDHFVGEDLRFFVHPGSWQLTWDALSALMAGDRPEIAVSFQVLRSDNVLIWLEARGRRMPDQKSCVLSMRDVTDRLLAEQQLSLANVKLLELASVDALTGLFNRRSFDEFLELELKRCSRTQQPISMVLLDIDHFKLFNDTYGHQEGDACLRAVAGAIEKYVRRPGDLAARYGGEEFAIVLPGACTAHAAQVAENLRIAIEDLQIDLLGATNGIVTASFGVATIELPGRADTGVALTKAADAYLYDAKRSGRNVVVFDRVLSRLPSLSRQNQAFRTGNTKDFSHVAATAAFGVLFSDFTKPDNPITFANPAFTALTGYGFEEVVGLNCRFLQGEDTDRNTVAELASAVRSGTAITRDILNYHKDGRPFWITLSLHPRKDESGAVVGFVATQIDVSDRYKTYEEVARLDASLASITDNLPGYIFQRVQEADASLSYSYFSPSYWRILGFVSPLKPTASDIFEHVDPRDIVQLRGSIARSLKSCSTSSLEFRAIAADDEVHWFRTYSTPRESTGGRLTWDGIGIDVTPEKTSQDRLTYLAYHDALTNLNNRQKFTEAMQEAIAPGSRCFGTILMFTINLDRFRQVNDALGSSVSDEVLKCVAARILASSGPDAVVARLYGDEFGVFWCGTIQHEAASERAEALCSSLSVPMLVNGYELAIKVSIGATMHELTPDDRVMGAQVTCAIQKRSGLAIAEAKRTGGGRYRWYDAELEERQQTNFILQVSLRRAVLEEQFTVLYQPLVDLRSGRILGAEALVRWCHPELGLQSPAMFIPMSEVTGLIIPLGHWVLKTALTEMMRWDSYSSEPPRISVNLSGTQILDPGFMNMIDQVLAETGADPRRIDLELTESVLFETIGSSVRLLEQLREKGFNLAIDDFGTGYSSFKYLQQLPVSKVKIDQTFIRNIVDSSRDKAIVRAIMAVAESLDLQVIVEGIEGRDQIECLCEEGCRVGQGFHFSRPLPAAVFRQILLTNESLPVGELMRPAPVVQYIERAKGIFR